MQNKTYYIITIGCQMNKSDSERLAGYLENQGYVWSEDKFHSDLVVVNTCGVRQSAEDRIYGIIPRIKKENPGSILVLTGCLSERSDVKRKLKNQVDVWLPIGEIPNLETQILGKETRFLRFGANRRNRVSTKDNCNYLKIKPKYTSKVSAFVPIGNGCNNYCSYCVVPYARGCEQYRGAEEIVDEVKELVSHGYKEINLIAQNVNSYKVKSKKYKAVDFPKLLQMVNDIPGNFWVRFATSHPKDMSEELINVVAECEKVCEHIHLPVQAGSNEILEKMNRGYTQQDYFKLIAKIKEKLAPRRHQKRTHPAFAPLRHPSQEGILHGWIPPVSITTDIIVGFPGESRIMFEESLALARVVRFDQIYIAEYSPRPGTEAAKLIDDVPKEEKKRREKVLTDVLKKTALENNQAYVGQTVEVLVEGKGRKGDWWGKTRTGKNVKVEVGSQRQEDLTGKFVEVKIIKAQEFGLSGKLVK